MFSKKKKILIPTHLSFQPEKTLRFAIELFRGESCTFCLLNTYQIPVSSASQIVKQHDLLKKQAQDELEQLLELLPPLVKGEDFDFEGVTMVGRPYRPVKRYLVENEVDVMIVGEKRPARNFKESIREVFAETQPVPVLVVPEKLDFHPFKGVFMEAGLVTSCSKKSLDFIQFLNQQFSPGFYYPTIPGKSEILSLKLGENGSTHYLDVKPYVTNGLLPDLRILPLREEAHGEGNVPVLFS
ncbi:MAG: universal stress protein [Bacteroidia bacterium]|nr:universal stress protein [Bacteroidia bacterium]